MFSPSFFGQVLILLVGGVAQAPSVPDQAVQGDQRVRAAFQGDWNDSQSGSDFAETAGYRELVAALLELKPADVAACHPQVLDFARAQAEPDALRGTWVRARGYVALRNKIPLSSPIGAANKVERAILKLDAEHAVVCDLVGDPPPFKNQADTIELSGVFYRSVTYQNADGKSVTLPYMLARSMELIDTPTSGMAKSLIGGGPTLLLGLLAGVIGVVAFVMLLRRNAQASE